jgi:hypothetical protein
MALRVILVGLVASLGLDLPSSQDVARMAQSGLDWASSQAASIRDFVADLTDRESDPGREAVAEERAPEGMPAEVARDVDATTTTEATLANVSHPTTGRVPTIEVVEESDEPATQVAADPVDGRFDAIVGEMASEFAGQADEIVPAATVAETEEEEPFAGIAYALNREADGIEDEWIVEEAEATATAERPQVAESEEESDDDDPRGARLGTAVRLTGQALQAWMSVLQQSTPTRRVGP